MLYFWLQHIIEHDVPQGPGPRQQAFTWTKLPQIYICDFDTVS